MNGFEQIKSFYSWVFNNPDKVRPTHISLYLFLWNQANRANWAEWFKCPYDLAMQGACIGNNGTYYRCLDELKEWGLIDYHKGINNYKAPLIHLICLYNNEQLNEHVSVPQSEQQTEQQTEQLPVHIYKLITNNIEPIINRFDEFEKIVNKFSEEKKGKHKQEFDFSFVSAELSEIFQRWIKYKQDRKEMYKSQDSLQTCYRNLIKISKNDYFTAVQIVEYSIGNNYAGLFPLKETQPIKTPSNSVNSLWQNRH